MGKSGGCSGPRSGRDYARARALRVRHQISHSCTPGCCSPKLRPSGSRPTPTTTVPSFSPTLSFFGVAAAGPDVVDDATPKQTAATGRHHNAIPPSWRLLFLLPMREHCLLWLMFAVWLLTKHWFLNNALLNFHSDMHIFFRVKVAPLFRTQSSESHPTERQE